MQRRNQLTDGGASGGGQASAPGFESGGDNDPSNGGDGYATTGLHGGQVGPGDTTSGSGGAGDPSSGNTADPPDDNSADSPTYGADPSSGGNGGSNGVNNPNDYDWDDDGETGDSGGGPQRGSDPSSGNEAGSNPSTPGMPTGEDGDGDGAADTVDPDDDNDGTHDLDELDYQIEGRLNALMTTLRNMAGAIAAGGAGLVLLLVGAAAVMVRGDS